MAYHNQLQCKVPGSVNTEAKIYALLISRLYLLSSHYLFSHFQKTPKINYYMFVFGCRGDGANLTIVDKMQ